MEYIHGDQYGRHVSLECEGGRMNSIVVSVPHPKCSNQVPRSTIVQCRYFVLGNRESKRHVHHVLVREATPEKLDHFYQDKNSHFLMPQGSHLFQH